MQRPETRRERHPARRLTAWIGAAMLAAVLALAAAPAVHAQFRQGEVPTVKLGITRTQLSGAVYTLEDKTTELTASSNASLQGSELFAEYVFMNRLGVEVMITATPLIREFELTLDNTELGTVREEARITLIGANLYGADAGDEGFNVLLGVFAGTLAASHTFSGGTLDGESSSVTVPLNVLRAGAEWVLENGGARVLVQSTSGQVTDTDTFTDYTQRAAYNGTLATLGIYAFF